MSVCASVCPSVRPSVTIYPTHFVDTTSTLPAGPIETGLDSYESQDIEPWPRKGHVSIALKTRLWRVAKVNEKYFSPIGSTWECETWAKIPDLSILTAGTAMSYAKLTRSSSFRWFQDGRRQWLAAQQ